MTNNVRHTWWPPIETPPPATWAYVAEDFTADDRYREWALAAALFIAKYTAAHGEGPTFSELFQHLLPESRGIPAPFPDDLRPHDRYRARRQFRICMLHVWRHTGLFAWRAGQYRSLNVRHTFAKRAQADDAFYNDRGDKATPVSSAEVRSKTANRHGASPKNLSDEDEFHGR